mmetsp:Transcript_23735/g.70419  ORF Transcript_23735/g.70419 Transcript_23735/m.70419 type:complete len:119 (+) Transcript_23735:1760-2116(+)
MQDVAEDTTDSESISMGAATSIASQWWETVGLVSQLVAPPQTSVGVLCLRRLPTSPMTVPSAMSDARLVSGRAANNSQQPPATASHRQQPPAGAAMASALQPRLQLPHALTLRFETTG